MNLQALPSLSQLPSRVGIPEAPVFSVPWFWRTPYSFFEIITDTAWWWFRMIQLPPNDQFNCKMYLQRQHEWVASPDFVSSSMGWEPGRSILSTTLFRNQEAASLPRCLQWAEDGRMTSTLHNWTGECAVKGGRAKDNFPLSCVSARKRGRRGKFFKVH